MATFHIPITCSNPSGSTGFRVRFRLNGDPTWTVFSIAPPPPTSGTTATTPQLLDNRIYNFQVQNINGVDNPLSTIVNDIGITDPDPVISPASNSVGYVFDNLSVDMTSYTVQLTTAADPGTIIETHVLAVGIFPDTIEDSFSGLDPLTEYRLVIMPVAGPFTATFVHNFVTLVEGGCPDVIGVTAELLLP